MDKNKSSLDLTITLHPQSVSAMEDKVLRTIEEGQVRDENYPEPATIALLGLGGLALLRREKRYQLPPQVAKSGTEPTYYSPEPATIALLGLGGLALVRKNY